MANFLKTLPFLKRLPLEQISLCVENQEFEIIKRPKDYLIEIDVVQNSESSIYLLISGKIYVR